MLKTVKNILRPALHLIRKPKTHMYLQEYLFRQALLEVGIVPASPISIDHLRGCSRVYDLDFGIKYPRSYLQRAMEIPIDRKYRYVFLGNMSPAGGRREMLAPFMGKDSLISEDNYGRNPNTKYSFNVLYYSALRSAWFSLCPHQADWKGPEDAKWTYRFIESAFSEVVPIVFRRAPCSESFLNGFEYFWDDENISLDDYDLKIASNKRLAEGRFFFTSEEVGSLKAAHARTQIG